MTALDLYNKLKPVKEYTYLAQFNNYGLDFNTSDMYSRLIKDAARCNNYASDVYYDLNYIQDCFENFDENKEFEPIWIGFRKMGVDGTGFVLSRCENKDLYGSLEQNYFALYCVVIKKDIYGLYKVIMKEYAV